MQNCPNCGAPIEPYKCRCEYCGTWYFDFTAFDMSDDKPYYVKFRSPMGVITTLAKPELQTIETNYDTVNIENGLGNTLKTFVQSVNCDIGVVFHAIPDKSMKNSLFTLQIDGG